MGGHHHNLTLILLAATHVAACAATVDDSSDIGSADVRSDRTYLALGDSIAFGWTPLVADQTQTDRFVGYPEVLDDDWHVNLLNASCPGEATGGFISVDGADNGCRANRELYPLHVSYEGTQLEFALATLDARPGTAVVTIDLGGNDLSILNDRCAGDPQCLQDGLPVTLGEVATNLATIFGSIRGHYAGPLVALTYYAFDYADPIETLVIGLLNQVITGVANATGAIVADGYGAFQAASAAAGSPCAAGLLAQLPDGHCDRHPSRQGQRVLAGAVRSALGNAGVQVD